MSRSGSARAARVFKRLAALTAPNGGALSRGCPDNCAIGRSVPQDSAARRPGRRFMPGWGKRRRRSALSHPVAQY
jgi:hypothetical protein